MSKVVINFSRWYVLRYDDNEYMLSGIADYHPKLGHNVYLSHTSLIQSSELKNDVLTCETINNIYVCPLKFIDKSGFANLRKVDFKDKTVLNKVIILGIDLYKGNKGTTFTQRIRKAVEDGQKELEAIKIEHDNHLIEVAKQFNNCVYMEVNSVSSGSTLAYNINGETGIIEPYVHLGMFQDSVLYTKPGVVDFRYFPDYSGFRIYNWSETIENLVIKNLKGYTLRVDKQEIGSGELIVIDRSNYSCGLVSPDCVTGQSMLTRIMQDEADVENDSEKDT